MKERDIFSKAKDSATLSFPCETTKCLDEKYSPMVQILGSSVEVKNRKPGKDMDTCLIQQTKSPLKEHVEEIETSTEVFNSKESQVDKLNMEYVQSSNNEDEYKYSCKKCDKTYKNLFSLKRHETTHLGIKFSCSKCISEFTRKDRLNAHMRQKHSEISPGSVSEDVPTPAVEETVVDRILTENVDKCAKNKTNLKIKKLQQRKKQISSPSEPEMPEMELLTNMAAIENMAKDKDIGVPLIKQIKFPVKKFDQKDASHALTYRYVICQY